MKKHDFRKLMIALFELVLLVAITYGVIVLLQSAGIAEDIDYENYETVFVMCHPESFVVIRSSPKKRNNEVTNGLAGRMFYTDGKERNGYLHVYGNFEGGEGWIKKAYVSIWEPIVYPYPEGKKFAVTVKNVFYRKWMNGPIKGKLKKGTVVTVWLEGEEWSVTNYGYIMTQFLTEVDGPEDI